MRREERGIFSYLWRSKRKNQQYFKISKRKRSNIEEAKEKINNTLKSQKENEAISALKLKLKEKAVIVYNYDFDAEIESLKSAAEEEQTSDSTEQATSEEAVPEEATETEKVKDTSQND